MEGRWMGQWMQLSDYDVWDGYKYVCSICGASIWDMQNSPALAHFCYNCGAKMDVTGAEESPLAVNHTRDACGEITAVDITMNGLGYELTVNGKKIGVFPDINAAVAAIYK